MDFTIKYMFNTIPSNLTVSKVLFARLLNLQDNYNVNYNFQVKPVCQYLESFQQHQRVCN